MMQSVKKQNGLSLIELLIAVAIGLFLTLGLTQLFTGSKQTYRVQENLSRLQENARFAMQFISRDIRMADFAGCNNNSVAGATDNINSASGSYDIALHDFTRAINGLEGADGVGAGLDLPDTITIVNANDSGVTVQSLAGVFGPLPSSDIQITSGNSFQQGDIVLIADCQQADILQITNANVGSANTIQHATGEFSFTSGATTTNAPGNTNPSSCAAGGTAHCLSKVYAGDATVYTLSTNTYEIIDNALVRNGDELVEGIESMQILYGQDTNNDHTANSYLPANAGGIDWDKVVSVRISLVARTIEDNLSTKTLNYTVFGDTFAAPNSDFRVRRVFTSTIALRNRLP